MSMNPSASSQEEAPLKYICGIDVGSQSCAGCVYRLDKSLVVKPLAFANAKEGWNVLLDKLTQLDALPKQILIGMEATARYSENLYHALEQRGYRLCLLHPGQTHQFHERQGLRAKTDRLDAITIARVLLSGEARAGYIPDEQVATYRELVRLHSQLSEQVARYQNQIHPTAKKLLSLASTSVSSQRAEAGRSLSLRILCGQLEQTQKYLEELQAELEQLIANDPAAKSLQQIPEFGTQTVAVLRAELGDVDRFARTDQAIAYAGLDVQIKESGLWKGKAKLSKRGSGPARGRCSIWRLCVAFICRGLPLGLTIRDWWHAVSRKAPP